MHRCLPLVLAPALIAGNVDHPTGNRTTPPTIASVAPLGVARGTVTELTIEGLNLAKASAVYFSEPGIKGRILRVKELPDQPEPVRLGSGGLPSTIDLGPLPPRNQVTVELDVSADANIGPVRFRLLTPLGTSPESALLVEPYYGESPDQESNDTLDNAFESYLPTILVGRVARPGDVDHYKIKVNAGDELVFEDGGQQLGSALQPVITILAPDQSVVREYSVEGQNRPFFAHRFDKAGTYYVRVSDYQQGGSANHFYRIKAGRFPLAISAYPLGVSRGRTVEVALKGYHLGVGKFAVKGEPSPEDDNAVIFRPATLSGKAFNRVKLALGDEPEIASAGTNTSLAAAQPVAVPQTVNGRIAAPENNVPVENYVRFKARKGEKLVIEVAARRLGSELDSLVEVLDAKGAPVERATVRAVSQTYTVLAERDSASRGIRIQFWNDMQVGDYLMIGGEIIRIEQLPRTPDEDVIFESFGGQRQPFFDTSTEAHAVDKPVYKVQIHAPGAQFAPNGLPLVRLYYRNDDGGPGYGKDSLLRFTAPADGDYIVRLRDVRGLGGDDYAYRLTVRRPRPDFELSVNPRNPNVPRGGSIPLTVTAFRKDDFDSAIEVGIEGLPKGIQATRGVIARGQVSTTLLLSANENAALESAAPLKVVGRAKIGERPVARIANPEDDLKLVALMPQADITMLADTREVALTRGGRAQVTVRIQRHNEFGGRVPVEVRNLPPGAGLPDFGLNGILLNETEDVRTFQIEALPNAKPLEQVIYVSGRVETRSPLQTSYAAPTPILLKIQTPAQVAKNR